MPRAWSRCQTNSKNKKDDEEIHLLLKFLGKPSLNNALRKFNSGMPFLRSEILIEIEREIANL